VLQSGLPEQQKTNRLFAESEGPVRGRLAHPRGENSMHTSANSSKSMRRGLLASTAAAVLGITTLLVVPVPQAQAGLFGGAIGGGLLGGIIGGRRGARAGAIIGGIAGAARAQRYRDAAYYQQSQQAQQTESESQRLERERLELERERLRLEKERLELEKQKGS
jgi:hypothetical protein